jgi:hypothetical protein
MKKALLVILLVLNSTITSAQSFPQEYYKLIKKADSLYNAKDFKNSAHKYSEAFRGNGWKAITNDRYKAACSWAMASVADSAFLQLTKIASEANYASYGQIITDPDLNSLHNDKRWSPLLEKIKQNKDKSEANLNKPLVAILDSIYSEDQKYRQQIDAIEKKYGWNSKEMQELWKTIDTKDAANLLKVQSILDKHGWLGADSVGKQGSTTLFLVIQHADQVTQEKYLPMMREAVKNGKAQSSNLALLEDRVALAQGKLQVYGSQIGQNPVTQTYFVLPLEDPDNVDKRRAKVGLVPMSEYLNQLQLKWDPVEYKKELEKNEGNIN